MSTSEKLSGLSPEQRAKLALRLSAARRQQVAQKADSLPEVHPDLQNRYEPFPLNDIQQAYLIGSSGGVEMGNISCQGYAELEVTDWNQERFEGALQKLIARHEMLRCIILPDGRQQILRDVPQYRVESFDLRKKEPASVTKHLDALRQKMSHQSRPTDRWPLFEFRVSHLDSRRSLLHISVDLLISDGRSFQIVFGEMARLYHDPQTVFPPLDLSFRDYLSAAAALDESENYRESKEYWMKRVPTLPPSPELPLAKNPASIAQPKFSRRQARIDAATWKNLKEKSARFHSTPAGTLLSAYAELLSIWSKNSRFTLNLTLFNRLPLHQQSNDILGDFTTVTLLEVDSSKQPTFEARARQIQEQLWQDMDHRYFSGIRVMRELIRIQGVGPKAIMPVIFTSLLNLGDQNSSTTSTNTLGKTVYSVSQTPQVYLDFIVQEDQGELVINWDAVDELFPAGLLDDLFSAYQNFLVQLASDDSSWQRSLAENTRRLLPANQIEIRRRVNDTTAPLSDELLHNLFLKQVDKRSNQIAVSTPSRKLTYAELFQHACGVEEQLLSRGAQPNQLVAVLMEKGWEQIVAVLGIQFAGAAYLPIDPGLPVERQCYLLEQTDVKIVLTQSALLPNLSLPAGIEVLAIDLLPAKDSGSTGPRSRQKPEDLAYIIYTSGSTGLPKGVMIDHRGAVNTVLDINQRYAVGPQDRVLALSRLNFDLSVYDIFGLLAAGGTIVMPAAELAQDASHWLELIAAEKVTIWNTVPALMQLLAEQASHSKNAGPSLRVVMMSGDWIPVNLPAQIRRTFSKAKLFSLGGATEASIWSILYPIEQVDPDWKSIPYGTPMRNQTFHVLNSALAPCPVWVPGQLYIGGVGLAKGYWRDGQKTNASFIIHPDSGERLYRTGDLGRYLPDGNIEFLGREDFQVKVNGYRIELGEIEYHLQGHEDVENCVVAVREDSPGDKRLVGYVVPKAGVPVEAAKLRDHLRSKLADYMVPSVFVFLERIPLSANGKVNRKALPAPKRASTGTNADSDAPRDAVELQLIHLWETILGVHPIARGDNFFEIGGTSLMAVRLFSQIEKSFGRKIPLAALFKTPTIEQLAEILRSDERSAAWSCLVPFQSNGSRPPLFCVHGHTGEVLFYRDLARNLGPGQPFYALQARGLTGGEAHLTIEESAMDYLRDVRAVQPHGPYFLAGYCFGGRIAFEMALQLLEQGEEVAFLAVFDTYFPAPKAQKSVKRLHRWLESRAVTGDPLLERLRAHLAQLRSLGFKERVAHFAKHGRNVLTKTRLRLGHWYWKAAYRYYSSLRLPLPRRLQDVPEINLLAAVKYKPRRLAGRLTLLLNGPVPEGFSLEQEFGWRGLLADKFDVHTVPGKQDGMFKDPHAIVLAEKMAACIENACAHASVPAESANSDPGSQEEVPAAVLDSTPTGQLHHLH